MNAHIRFLHELLGTQNYYFYIPVYQRNYSWSEHDCTTLLRDLEFLMKNNLARHFFGSVVYTSKDKGLYHDICIIDGQQRIVTMMLLYLAIVNAISERNDNIDENGDEIVPIKKIKDLYFYKDPYKTNKSLKYSLTPEDDGSLKNIFVYEKIDENSVIGKNYSLFEKYFKNKTTEFIRDIYFASTKLEIVNVVLEHQDDPQRIFESLNSKSCPLRESDKVRNFILMDMDKEEQEILYKKFWLPMASNIGDDKISTLIRIFLSIKTNDFVPENQIYYSFKSYFINNDDVTSELALSEIYKYSIYMSNCYSFNKYSKYSYQKSIYRLNNLDMSTIFPLVFVCFDHYKDLANDKNQINELDEIMNYVESFIVRRNFLKLSNGALNKIFAFMPGEITKYVNDGKAFKEAVYETFKDKTSNSRFPKDSEFKDAFVTFELYNAKSSFKKYILERLENYNRKELIDVDNDIKNNILTIEHVMPQTLTNEWIDELGANYDYIHSKYKDTIGNLTLTAYNSELSNKSFTIKLNDNEYGYKTSNLNLNKYIKAQKEWKERQILERANKLLEIALLIWRYPEVSQIEDKSFDLSNPETWNTVPITQLARVGFRFLISNDLITKEEFNSFLTKEKSKELLRASYPIFSFSRESNGKKTHWAKEPYLLFNQTIYLSYEWFPEQYEILKKYLLNKLNLNS